MTAKPKSLRNRVFAFLKTVRRQVFGAPRPVISILRLEGVIGSADRFQSGLNHDSLAKQIDAAFASDAAKAVALVINSPGGSPVQSGLIYAHIRRLAEEKDLPVYTFAEDVAASGGYMLMLAGDKLYGHDTSLIGSIGVVGGGFGFVEALAKLGLEGRVYTQGENKVRLDPFLPEKVEDKDWLDSIQKDIHSYFKDLVRQRRGDKLKGRRGDLFSGDVWLSPAAVKNGLIDGIGDMQTVMREEFGEDVRFKQIEKKRSFLSMILSSQTRHDSPQAWLSAIEQRLIWQRWGL